MYGIDVQNSGGKSIISSERQSLQVSYQNTTSMNMYSTTGYGQMIYNWSMKRTPYVQHTELGSHPWAEAWSFGFLTGFDLSSPPTCAINNSSSYAACNIGYFDSYTYTYFIGETGYNNSYNFAIINEAKYEYEAPSDTYGLRVYDSAGTLTFDSRRKVFNVVDVKTVTPNWTDTPQWISHASTGTNTPYLIFAPSWYQTNGQKVIPEWNNGTAEVPVLQKVQGIYGQTNSGFYVKSFTYVIYNSGLTVTRTQTGQSFNVIVGYISN